jgi:Domain of unknown function (DUF4861)
MNSPRLLLLAALAALVPAARADALRIHVHNSLPIARPSETIAVPWSQVAHFLPGARLQHIAVHDAKGNLLAYQVTNVAPEAKDPHNLGIAYGDLLFQHDFAAGESDAEFTVERIEAVAPVFPVQAFARYVPERYDDFAWENDRIAHRTYGPALQAPDTAGTGKEVLVSSGIDVWSKRVRYPIVDRWYNKGHDHYHVDEGEGMDMYNVGSSRGDGGTGVWDGKTLAVSGNYATWKVIANGPIRAIFELAYAPWAAAGRKVSEVKRYTVDAGHNLDLVESTFTVDSGDPALTVALGLCRSSADKGEEPKIAESRLADAAAISVWEAQRTHGAIGTAVVVDRAAFAGFAEEPHNFLLLAHATSGKPVRFLAGAGWTKSGDFASQADWEAYVTACAQRLASPVEATCSAAP